MALSFHMPSRSFARSGDQVVDCPKPAWDEIFEFGLPFRVRRDECLEIYI